MGEYRNKKGNLPLSREMPVPVPVLDCSRQVCECVAGEPESTRTSISQRATGLLFGQMLLYVAMQATSCRPRNLQDTSFSVTQQPFVRIDGPKRLGSWLLGFWRSVRQTDRKFAIDSTTSGSGNHGSQNQSPKAGFASVGIERGEKGGCARCRQYSSSSGRQMRAQKKEKRRAMQRRKVEVNDCAAVFR